MSFTKMGLNSTFILGFTVMALAGCASKNPLIDEAPAPTAPKAEVQTSPLGNGAQVSKPEGFQKFLGYISPYRITVQQGNFISKETISQLKEGMTREQVRFLLGTALLTDIFHEDRWDYPFSLLKPNGELISSRVTVYFKNNQVVKFEGGDLPTEKDYLAHITNAAIKDKAESSESKEAPKKKPE